VTHQRTFRSSPDRNLLKFDNSTYTKHSIKSSRRSSSVFIVDIQYFILYAHVCTIYHENVLLWNYNIISSQDLTAYQPQRKIITSNYVVFRYEYRGAVENRRVGFRTTPPVCNIIIYVVYAVKIWLQKFG